MNRDVQVVGPIEPTEFAVLPLEPLMVRVDVAMRLIGIGRTKLYALIGAGEIETVKIGTRTLVVYSSLKRLLEHGA